MNTANVTAESLNKTISGADQLQQSVWRRMFNAWVRSYDARISGDGKVFFVGL